MADELTIEDRRSRAAKFLEEKGFSSLSQLSHTLGVSESTIRRDLEILEEQGLIKRTHGGAVYVKDTAEHRLAFAEREMSAAEEKRAIGRAVAELIPAGQTLLLDGGTTCYQVARSLLGRRLNVVTNAVSIAALLSADVVTEVTLIGGYVYPRTGVAMGTMAEQQIRSLHASQLVLSCAGVAADGVYNANQMMVDVDRAMMDVADEAILAVDHTKFNTRAVVRLCELDALDVIVTDAGADDATRQWLATLPAKVIYAETTQ